MSNAKYMSEVINEKLAGTAIRNAVVDEENDAFGFQVVRKAEGRGNYDVFTVWVDCDPEGNGPGWLSIDEGE